MIVAITGKGEIIGPFESWEQAGNWMKIAARCLAGPVRLGIVQRPSDVLPSVDSSTWISK